MKNSQLRVSFNSRILSPPLTGSDESYSYLLKIWDKALINIQEQVYLLCLNNSNEVIGWRCINTGTGNETLFDIKFALSCSLNCLASKIIIAHNHPSGMLKPSGGDLNVTDRLSKAAELMDIKLLDHIIVNRNNYYSFKDHGVLKT